MSPEVVDSERKATPVKIAYGAAALWIFGGAAYFYVRFSIVFFNDNRAAIEGLIERVQSLMTIT